MEEDPFSHLSPNLRHFLHLNLRTRDDLLRSPSLAAALLADCSQLDSSLSQLSRHLSDRIAEYASHSETLYGALGRLKSDLGRLASSSMSEVVIIDMYGDGDGDGKGKGQRIWGDELQALAKEVARVESIRSYAEVALKLDSLIGDVEDAVSSSMAGKQKALPVSSLEEKRLLAIKCLKETEDVLDCVAKSHPQWSHLLAAVDHRVDRALAVLRPKAIADHRSLLASLGWPPPLSKFGVEKSPQCLNPFLLMQGNLKNQYRENFLALCSLQEFQMRRKARQLSDFNLMKSIHQPLWVIEELVNPIALTFQNYFSKWSGKPEFIFALVYKITKDFVESMDEILQPLVDKARLVGYSCREEWISAMVSSLTTYLAKEVFPSYLSHLEDEGAGDSISQARDLWLHLIDMIISFDKQTRSLLVSTGAIFIVTEDEKLRRVSSLSVFCDRPDWLDLWAQIELSDMTDKLKHELDDDRNWQKKIQESLLVSGSEVCNCPLVAGILLQLLSTLIDRCRSIPGNFLRSRFVRLAAAPLVLEFLDRLLQKCQEAEGLTSLVDDDALSKVSISINAAHYCESVLKEWCEDVFFLEMAADVANNVADLSDGIFYVEMQKLSNFQTEWVEKISTVILRGFDAQTRDYVKNKKQWQEKGEEGWTVSRTFIAGLDYLQSKMSKMKQDLNDIDFVRMWRSVAGGIDHLIFYGVIMGNAKFYDAGVEKLESDLSVLFKIFGAWCVRPKGFFPKCSEGLTLLKMKEVQLREELEKGKEIWLRKNALRHLSVAEAEKIAKNRIFVS